MIGALLEIERKNLKNELLIEALNSKNTILAKKSFT